MSLIKPSPGDATIGPRITAFRKAKGLSQSQLGAAIGVTFQQVQKYENGTNRVSGNRLQAVARALDVPISALFDEVETTAYDGALAFLKVQGAIELLKIYEAIDESQLRCDVLVIVRLAARMGREKSPPGDLD